MTGNPWPAADENEPTPIYDGVLTKENDVPLLTPDEDANVPQTSTAIHPGYRELTDQERDVVASSKEHENELGRWLKQLMRDVEDIDGRWVSIARTHFQQGFMALTRAVTRPESEL